MRKLPQQKKIRQARLAWRSWKRQLRRRKIKKIRGPSTRTLDFSTRIKQIRNTAPKKYTLKAPANFNLKDNFDEVVLFLTELRKRYESPLRRAPIRVDFTTIKHLSAISALILTAEVDRWRLVTQRGLRPLEFKKWSPAIRRRLNEMGFFEVLNIENPCTDEDKVQDEELKFLRFISGTSGDGELVRNLRQGLEQIAGPVMAKTALYEGLTEAMVNSVEHAYPETRNFHPEVKHRWWMSGSYNRETGRMFVMIYDVGVGIPFTIVESVRWGGVVRGILQVLGLSPSPGNLIKAAMEIGRTQTNLENRGNGLDEMRRFIMQSGMGMLRIISKEGDYTFSHNEKESVNDHSFPLEGTLIAWEIWLKGVPNNDD